MKQNLLAKIRPDQKSPEDEIRSPYYENASARFGIAQVIIYLFLLLFVVLSLFNNRDLVTYENFYYFFKDLNAVNLDLYDADTVSFPTDEIQSFTLYRKGLAVAGNNSVSIFTQTGRQLVSSSISYRNPVAVGSGKYLLVYDLGGKNYSLYNSYSRIHTGTTDDPITASFVSPSGDYAIATKNDAEGLSTICFYNDRFTMVNRYRKTGYVMDLSINDKGNLLAILLSDVSSGAVRTKVFLYVPGESTHKAEVLLNSGLGVSCRFTSAAHLSVLSEHGADDISYSGASAHLIDFDGRRILAAELSSDGLSLYLSGASLSEKNQLFVFDKTGRRIYRGTSEENYRTLSRSGKMLFCLSDGFVERINTSSGKREKMSIDTGGKKLLSIDGGEFLLCTPQKAATISFRSD
ncbi:MAG: hypothetical protein IJR88_01325 [Clostridia bacterium]|nr:hypothetical protein [Clostridia bacterium]